MRPAALARELDAYDVANVGAAGTFVVRRPGRRGQFVAQLRRSLGVNVVVACCDSRELVELASEDPFKNERTHVGRVPFVSVLATTPRTQVALPVSIPTSRGWFVRILGSRNRLVYGVYRRHMRTIGHLDRIDELFGAPATTRSWNTMRSVLRILNPDAPA